MLKEAAAAAGIPDSCITAFAADATSLDAHKSTAGTHTLCEALASSFDSFQSESRFLLRSCKLGSYL